MSPLLRTTGPEIDDDMRVYKRIQVLEKKKMMPFEIIKMGGAHLII